MRFRQKPVEVQAYRWTGAARISWPDWLREAEQVSVNPDGISLSIETLEDVMIANKGDWIIQGVKGGLCSCKPDIFEQTFEPSN